jgi:hypothetical protein
MVFSSLEPEQVPEHIRKHLDPSEKVVIARRFHWATILEPVSVVVVGLFVTLAVDLVMRTDDKNAHVIAWAVWAAWLLWTASEAWDLASAGKQVRSNGRSQILSVVVAGLVIYAGSWVVRNKSFGVGGLLLIVLLLVLVWSLAEIGHWSDRYLVLTNKRIMVIEGLIARSVNSMPLSKLTDMIYHRSAIGRLLNFGLFDVESAGQDQALKKINYVPDPDDTNLQISHLLWKAGDPPGPKNIMITGKLNDSGNVTMTGQMDG